MLGTAFWLLMSYFFFLNWWIICLRHIWKAWPVKSKFNGHKRKHRKKQLYSSDSRFIKQKVACLTWPSTDSVFKNWERRPLPRCCCCCCWWNTLVDPPPHTTPHCVCWTASWGCRRQTTLTSQNCCSCFNGVLLTCYIQLHNACLSYTLHQRRPELWRELKHVFCRSGWSSSRRSSARKLSSLASFGSLPDGPEYLLSWNPSGLLDYKQSQPGCAILLYHQWVSGGCPDAQLAAGSSWERQLLSRRILSLHSSGWEPELSCSLSFLKVKVTKREKKDLKPNQLWSWTKT